MGIAWDAKSLQKNKGQLVLLNVSENMQQSLDLAGVKHFINMYDDLTEAVASF